MQQYILGVDIGTGSVKAVAVGKDGKAVKSSSKHYPEMYPESGFVEQDVELIWQGFLDCVREIVKEMAVPPEAIGFSSAMHGLILVDGAGKNLTNMINWADIRSAEIAGRIRFSPAGKPLYEECGTPIYSMSPLSKIIWFRENRKEIFDQAAKFISIKELFWFRLFGAFQVDHSIASATGMFDIGKFCWSEKALKAAGIDAGKLSEAVSTTLIRNDAKAEILSSINLKTDTCWIIGANDGCLANLGSQAVKSGTVALTIGTSGAVRLASRKTVDNFEAMIFNYILDEKTYISGGAINNGGLILNWLLENFMAIKTVTEKDYQQFFETIKSVAPGSGLLFLPYLTGERTPLWDSNSCGVFFGIKTAHRQEHFLKAGLEGVCYAIRHVFEAVAQHADPINEIMVSGGFTTSPVWLQMMADILGKQLIAVQTEDASSIGAAYLAIQTGKFKGFNVKNDTRHQNIVKPDLKNHETYNKLYPLFVKIYQDLKGSMQQLAGLNQPG